MRTRFLTVLVLGWLAACGSTVVVDIPGGSTSTAVGGCGGWGCGGTWSDGWSDGSWSDGADGAGITCYDCACYYGMNDSPAGCADICDNTISGTTVPNFCNGSPALTQCTACIWDRCGSDPNNCY